MFKLQFENSWLNRNSRYTTVKAAIFLLVAAFLLSGCQQTQTTIPSSSLKNISVVIDDNYPPFSFLDSDGNLQGISIDQWRLWEKKTGISVQITGMDWSKALQSMEDGKFDVIDTIFYDDSRALLFDFSPAYETIDVPIYFNNEISGITDAQSLKGFPVAVKSGDAVINFLEEKGVNNLLEFDSYEAIIKAAAAHDVIVFAIDKPPAEYFLYQNNIQNEFNATQPLYSGQFHRAVLKGNSSLLALINAGFANISTSEFAAIDRKWYGTPAISIASLKDAGYIIGGIGFLFFALLIWNRSLRVNVRRQTKIYQESEARFRRLFDSSPISLWEEDFSLVKQRLDSLRAQGVTDFSAFFKEHPELIREYSKLIKIIDVNQKTLEMFGVTNKDELFAELEAILPPTNIKNEMYELEQIANGLSNFHLEAINQTIDGKQIVVELNWAALPGYESDLSKTIVSLIDITKRKKAEEEIKNLNRDLEARVRNRTSQLEKSNQELEAFSYSVSHDLRAPLRAINGYSQIIEDDYSAKLNDEVIRYLDLIKENSSFMGRLIDDLLDYSRLGKVEVKREKVDPAPLVKKVIEIIYPKSSDRKIDFIINPLPECEADPILLQQVFMNLIDNAIKFTDKQEIAVIEIGSIRTSPPNQKSAVRQDMVCYYVRDNGIGFDEQYTDKMFGIFQRLQTADEYEGTGVGLALVKRIISRHGGFIWVESTPDKGATFFFSFGG